MTKYKETKFFFLSFHNIQEVQKPVHVNGNEQFPIFLFFNHILAIVSSFDSWFLILGYYPNTSQKAIKLSINEITVFAMIFVVGISCNIYTVPGRSCFSFLFLLAQM